MSNVIARLINEKGIDFNNRMIKIISALDTGILSFELKKQSIPHHLMGAEVKFEGIDISEVLKNELPYKIITKHNVFDKSNKVTTTRPFDISLESSGTRSLFAIVYFLLDALESGKSFYIDEFEQNLHPLLVKSLIEMFQNPVVNTKNAQLLFTTHDVTLIDNELFRRDQVWFTEKDEYGKTGLYSMANIDGARNNVPYDKWYLSGKYGATPIINEPDLIFNKGAENK